MSDSNIIVGGHAKAMGAYPHAKRVGDFVFVCGTSSRRPDNSHAGVHIDSDGNTTLDIREQTRAVIHSIERILKTANLDLGAVVDITTFLTDMSDFAGYNEVYGEFFDATTGPARTTVGVRELPHPNLLIEIKATAYDPR